jgi:primase-polymerase (primpol)-like protein
VTVYGAPASSTNPATWTTYDAVVGGRIGDGYGVMLGGGLGCWDFDHCIVDGRVSPEVVELLRSIERPLWVERSVSGEGLHVFVRAAEAPGWKRGRVEFYSRARFIRFTGDRFAVEGL